jgi:alpha-glucosidase
MSTDPWWQDCVIYHIYPRSFQDSNGDGIGDLRGIIERVDYLAGLGVGGIWFSPFFTSPMADFGYDIANYTDIDPSFGTLADFDEMIAALHRHNIRVILDFVPNHTSDRHPWFLESRSSRESPKRDWYLWRDPSPDGGPPNNWQSMAGGPSWEYDAATGQYYCHTFLKQQVDLHWHNPVVRDAMYDVLRFWLARSVDGFRIDAVGCLAKDPLFRDDPPNPAYKENDAPFARNLMVNSANGPQIFDIIAGIRDVVSAYSSNKILIGEVYLKPTELAPYYGARSDGLQLPTNMNLLWTPWKPAPILDIVEAYEASLPKGAWPNWVLGNHDQSRIATRVGRAQAPIAMMLLLTLRGTPVLYYGDELGLEDMKIPPAFVHDPFGLNMPGKNQGRDPQRCPMPWDETAKAGFTTGDPWLPIGTSEKGHSVAAQQADPRSMLALTHELMRLRREEPALSRGFWEKVEIEGEVLAYARTLADKRFVIVLNLDGEAKSIRLKDVASGRVLLSTHARDKRPRVQHELDLAANEGVIIAA